MHLSPYVSYSGVQRDVVITLSSLGVLMALSILLLIAGSVVKSRRRKYQRELMAQSRSVWLTQQYSREAHMSGSRVSITDALEGRGSDAIQDSPERNYSTLNKYNSYEDNLNMKTSRSNLRNKNSRGQHFPHGSMYQQMDLNVTRNLLNGDNFNCTPDLFTLESDEISDGRNSFLDNLSDYESSSDMSDYEQMKSHREFERKRNHHRKQIYYDTVPTKEDYQTETAGFASSDV
ncbi:unnamed protein product [Trichobilharzia szidati]|nr:unnamed protein product [Trichobilharzia szidati]